MPITNPTLGFKLTRDLNNIIVEKIGSRDISVQIFYKTSLNTFSTATQSLNVDNTITIKIPFKDGQYKIRITSTDPVTEEFEYKEFLFNNFNQLLNSIITDAKYYLCGCDCQGCKDCNDEEGKAKLLLKMMSFYILNKDYYKFFFNTGLKCIEDTILVDINCSIAQEFILDKSDNKSLSNTIIGYLYYIFYLGEKSIYTCCTEQVDYRFKIGEIRRCLERNNLNIVCIENTIVTDPDYYITDSNFIEL